MTVVPPRNDLIARIEKLERLVSDLGRRSSLPGPDVVPTGAPVAVSFAGPNYTLTTTPTTLTGLSAVIHSPGLSAVFHVDLTFDFAATTGGNRVAVGQLLVGLSAQPAQALASFPTTGERAGISQHYLVTGLPPGDYSFEGQAFQVDPGSPTGVLICRGTHTTMIITQEA